MRVVEPTREAPIAPADLLSGEGVAGADSIVGLETGDVSPGAPDQRSPADSNQHVLSDEDPLSLGPTGKRQRGRPKGR